MKMKRAATLLLSILLLAGIAGCDDTTKTSAGGTDPVAGNTDPTNPTAPPTTTPSPTTPTTPNPNTPTTPGPQLGFVVTSDFSVGNLSKISTTSPRTSEKSLLGATGLHSDSVIRGFGKLVYVIQRFGANSIVVLDSEQPSASIANYTTNDRGNTSQQSNPQDIAFVSESKAYITRYGLNTLLVVNPRTGDQLGTIGLSQFLDPTDTVTGGDGSVEMAQMVMIGTRLFVSLQRLTGFAAVLESYIVVIDTDTDQIIELSPGRNKIVLAGKNPFDMVYLPSTDRIYVANVGTFFTGDDFGGLEVINPNTGLSEGIVLTDNAFGGPLSAIAIQSDTKAYASVFDASFNNFVVPFDLTAIQVAAPLSQLGGGSKSALAVDNKGFLYIADQDIISPGIQVIDTNTNLKVAGPIDTGLPPNGIVFVSP